MLQSERALLPAPNWYNAHTATLLPTNPWIDSSDTTQACLAYAARSTIVVVNVNTWTVCDMVLAHTHRTNAVAAQAHGSRGSWLASGGDDKIVKAWALPQWDCVASHAIHEQEVTSLAVANGPVALIVSGDKAGYIVCYNALSNRHAKVRFHQSAIFVIRIMPSEDQSAVVVAVGHQNGAIVIASIAISEDAAKPEPTKLYQLDEHNEEIHDLLWLSPCETDLTWRLISSARDKTLRLWDVNGESVVQWIKLPKPKGHYTQHQRSRIWVPLAEHVVHPNAVYCGSYMGEVLSWDYHRNRFIAKASLLDGPSRCVFQLLVSSARHELYTISMDRQIAKYDIDSRKLQHKSIGLGGHAYQVTISSLDPERAAVACGDGTIRLWQVSQLPHTCSSTLLWRGLKGRITGVLWHPTDDNLLVYADDTGFVGVFDLLKETAQPFRTSHRTMVSMKAWCPASSLNSDQLDLSLPDTLQTLLDEVRGQGIESVYFILSCSTDGALLLHDPLRPKAVFHNLNAALLSLNPTLVTFYHNQAPKRCAAAFDSPTHPQLLLLGNTDGSVEIYRWPSLLFGAVYICHRGRISSLACKHFTNTNSRFEGHCIMAVASSDSTISLHRIDHLSRQSSGTTEQATSAIIPITTPLATLRGHAKDVSDMAWHPLPKSSLLATASFDGTVIVWDAALASRVAQFTEHVGRCLAVAWDLLDFQFVLSGSDDQTVRRWNYTTVKQVSKRLNSRTSKSQDHTTNKGPSGMGPNMPQKDPTDDAVALPHTVTTPLTLSPTVPPAPGQTLAKRPPTSPLMSASTSKPNRALATKKRRKNKQPILFPELNQVTLGLSKDTQRHRCWQLACQRADPHRVTQLPSISGPLSGETKSDGSACDASQLLFGDDTNVQTLVAKEANSHAQRTSASAEQFASLLNVWSGDVIPALSRALESPSTAGADVGAHQLLYLALSPMAGRDVWVHCMSHMAERYARAGDAHTATLLYLAIDQPDKAVKVYTNAENFREALILARLRLPDQADLILSLWQQWATRLMAKGYYEQAAQCHLQLGDYSAALDILSRRTDFDATKLTADIALIANDASAAFRLQRLAEEAMLRPNVDLTMRLLASYRPIYHDLLDRPAKDAVCTDEMRLTSLQARLQWDYYLVWCQVEVFWQHTMANVPSTTVANRESLLTLLNNLVLMLDSSKGREDGPFLTGGADSVIRLGNLTLSAANHLFTVFSEAMLAIMSQAVVCSVQDALRQSDIEMTNPYGQELALKRSERNGLAIARFVHGYQCWLRAPSNALLDPSPLQRAPSVDAALLTFLAQDLYAVTLHFLRCSAPTNPERFGAWIGLLFANHPALTENIGLFGTESYPMTGRQGAPDDQNWVTYAQHWLHWTAWGLANALTPSLTEDLQFQDTIALLDSVELTDPINHVPPPDHVNLTSLKKTLQRLNERLADQQVESDKEGVSQR